MACLTQACAYEGRSFRIILYHQDAHELISRLRLLPRKQLSYEFLLFLYTKLNISWQA
jgi:hypothetical protein